MWAPPLPRFSIAALLLVAACTGAFAERSRNFDLIPKAFQPNPKLEMTVLSEMTDAGRTMTQTSPRVVYYALAPGKYRTNFDVSGTQPPKPEEMERMLREALRSRGYQPANATQRPTVLITYAWGAHWYPDVPEATLSEQVVLENVLERAQLVGGDKFASDLAHALVDRSNVYAASANPLSAEIERHRRQSFDNYDDSADGRDRGMNNIQFDMGAAAGLAMMNGVSDPVRLFIQKDPRNESLINQSADDVYYVIASAYDYASVAADHRQLLWRTRMTVNARSVSQAHALPLLVSNTASFLATDMKDPEVLVRRSMRTPQIDVGTPTIVDTPGN